MKLWKYIKNNMQINLGQKVCEENSEMTYEELLIFAESFSRRLEGIKCCAVLCHSEMAAGMALLSCFAAGVTAVPLSKRYGKAHCNKILAAISPNAIITDSGGSLQIISVSDSSYRENGVHPALIMCTSGTTGTPKGAMLTEENIISNVSAITEYFDINSKDYILIPRPLYHCAVLTGEFLTALVKGTKIRFYSERFNPVFTLKLIRENKITAFCGTPTQLSMMARIKKEKDSLKHICISGECMDKKTGIYIQSAFISSKIYHVYGLTEACPRVSYLPPQLFGRFPDFVGIPLNGVSVKILLNDQTEAQKGETGVLWVKGGNVMAGYYNDLEKTKRVLKDGWLCTGDLAVINEDGLLKILGRNDDMIIKSGMNIYPQEIESAVKADPRVREVCVCGKEDKKLGMQIVMNISGDFESSLEVKKMCREILPPYQVPSKINLVDEIPKNGSGKIIRRF